MRRHNGELFQIEVDALQAYAREQFKILVQQFVNEYFDQDACTMKYCLTYYIVKKELYHIIFTSFSSISRSAGAIRVPIKLVACISFS